MSDDLSQYPASFQTDPRYSGIQPVVATPTLPPAYGQQQPMMEGDTAPSAVAPPSAPPGGGGGGGGSSAAFPCSFRVFTQPGQWGVYANSILFNSSGIFSDTITVTGLLSSDPPSPTDANWINIGSAPDTLFLLGTIGTFPAVSTAEIKSTGSGASMGGGMVEYSASGTPAVYAQTFFRLPIALAFTSGVFNVHIGALILDIAPRIGNDSSGSNPLVVPAVFPFPL